MRSGPVEPSALPALPEGRANETSDRAIGCHSHAGALGACHWYSVVVSWIVKYMTGSITGSVLKSDSVDGFAASFGQMASSFGNNMWLIIVLVITFVIMAAGISSGIEKANKVMIPVFYVLFIGSGSLRGSSARGGGRLQVDVHHPAGGFKDPMLYVFAWGSPSSLCLWRATDHHLRLLLVGQGGHGELRHHGGDLRHLRGHAGGLVIIPAMATTGAVLSESGPG